MGDQERGEEGEIRQELRQTEVEIAEDRERLSQDEERAGREERELREIEDAKPFKIIVNGTKFEVSGRTVTFDQIVLLGYPTPPTGTNIVYTITYRRGPNEKPEGSMVPGQTVGIKRDEIFNVSATDKS